MYNSLFENEKTISNILINKWKELIYKLEGKTVT